MIKLSRDSIAYKKLLPISRWLNKLDVDYCNTGKRDEVKFEALLEEAEKICESIGLKAFHQADPRGCSLYVIDNTMNDSNYTNGIAVYE